MAETSDRISSIALLLKHDWSQQAQIRKALVEERSPLEVLKQFANGAEWISKAEAELRNWEQAGYNVATYFDQNFPQQLRDVHDFPLALFWKGALWDEEGPELGVSIVGSRDPNQRSMDTASWLANELVQRDITVVSGLARGIDTVAHRSAIEAGGRTVGVIGTGIDVAYPRENAQLQDLVAEQGLLISQFLPGSGPTRISFPMRNAVMSAYSSATMIVQASEKSGTRHQATAAFRHGRPVILSESVVEQTSWGRKFAEKAEYAQVEVVSSPAQALEACLKYATRTFDLEYSLV